MSNLFVYGTLLNSEIVYGLTGKEFESVDFLLKGFSRYRIFDGPDPRSYPALTEDKMGSVKGKILFHVDERSLKLLDLYEDREYTRQEIFLEWEGAVISAFVYVWDPAQRHKLHSSWDLKEFEKNFLNHYLDGIIPRFLAENPIK